MGGDSSFLAMLRIAGFLAATWGATKVSRLAGISSIVLEITTGVVLGPGIVGLIPPEYSECEHATWTDCSAPKGFSDGLGTLGEFLTPIAEMDVCDKELYQHCSHEAHGDGHGHHDGPIAFNFTVANLSYEVLEMASHGNGTLEMDIAAAATTFIEDALATATGHAGHTVDVELHGDEHVMAMVHVHPADEGHAEDVKHELETLVQEHSFMHGLTEALLDVPGLSEAAECTESSCIEVGDFELSWGHEEDGHGDGGHTDGGHTDDGHTDDGHTDDGHADDGHGGGHRRLSGGHSCSDLDYDTYGECLLSECDIETQSKCQKTPDVFTLIGHTGVAMMIFESGMHFDFKMARKVGPWACVVAVIGTILPLICGMLVAMAYGKPVMPDGMTAGTALAPTSVGISLRLLSEAGVLQEEFGQSIMTAAFVDDILSLVLFNIIFSLGDGHLTFMYTFFPSLMGILFMMFAVVLAVVFWPKFLSRFVLPSLEMAFERAHSAEDEELDLQEQAHVKAKPSLKDEALFMIMLLMLLGYATVTYLCGTHLWGCFIAGMSFACLEPVGHAHHVWVKQTKRVTSWMIRIFFSCTVAFAIPVTELLSISAFWKGAIMGIGPCILTKVCCALFMGKPKFVIGWAMVGRAEFAYLIAQMGVAGNMIDQELFSIVIWALLWATIFAPIVFRIVLVRYIKENNVDVGGALAARRKADLDDMHGGGTDPVGEGSPKTHSVVEVVKGENGKGTVKDESGAAWEDSVLDKHTEEVQALARAGPGPQGGGLGGRGVLCCVFFKKATTA